MQRWLLYGILGGLAYWMFFGKKAVVPPTQITEAGEGHPVTTTGAPQPMGVQAYPRAIADVYDLQAFPMGTFSKRD